jgi:metallo-beta-lactamase family protein
MGVWPEEIRLVHGEVQAKKALGQVLERKFFLSARKLRLVIPGS